MPYSPTAPAPADDRTINRIHILEIHTYKPIGQIPFRRYLISFGNYDGTDYVEIKRETFSVDQEESQQAMQDNPDIAALMQNEKDLSYLYLETSGRIPPGTIS